MKTMREITDWTAWTHRLRLAIVVLFVTGAVAQTHYSDAGFVRPDFFD